MALPNNALVLVADGRKMLFFRNHGDENQIDLRTEAHDEREDRKDREIKTDAPGTVQQSFGSGRSTALGVDVTCAGSLHEETRASRRASVVGGGAGRIARPTPEASLRSETLPVASRTSSLGLRSFSA